METEKIIVNQQYPDWIQAILAKGMNQKDTTSEIMNKGLGLGMSLNEIFQFIIAIYGISIAFSLFSNLGGGIGGFFGGNSKAATTAVVEKAENSIDTRICEIQTAMAANDARQAAYQKCDEEYRALKNHEAVIEAIKGIAEANAISTERVINQMKEDKNTGIFNSMKEENLALRNALENQKFTCLQNEVSEIGSLVKGLYERGNGCCNNPQVVYTTKSC